MLEGIGTDLMLFVAVCLVVLVILFAGLGRAYRWVLHRARVGEMLPSDLPPAPKTGTLTDEEYQRYKAEAIAQLKQVTDWSEPIWHNGSERISTVRMIFEIGSDSPRGRQFVTAHAKFPQYTSPRYRNLKEEFLEYLRSRTDREAKGLFVQGGQNLSINETIAEVEKDTDTGRSLIEMYANVVLKRTATK